MGPTPQRDGKVLGLFDIIDEDEDEEPDQSGQTPSRSRVLRDSSQNTHRTPRKPLAEEEIVTPLRYGKTPTSSSKRFLLDMFVTPSKRKAAADHELDGDEDVTTKPAFLRREYYHHHDHHRHSSNHHKAVRYDENGNLKMDAPSAPVVVPVRRPAKPPVRGLSSIIAGLRKMEEERLDEELDILRELENERTPAAAAAAGLPPHSLVGEKKPSMTMNDSAKASTEAGGAEVDSLTNNNDNDDDDDENIKSNQAEQPSGSSKPWKKRGQKRTNKKVLSMSFPSPSLFPSYSSSPTPSTGRKQEPPPLVLPSSPTLKIAEKNKKSDPPVSKKPPSPTLIIIIITTTTTKTTMTESKRKNLTPPPPPLRHHARKKSQPTHTHMRIFDV